MLKSSKFLKTLVLLHVLGAISLIYLFFINIVDVIVPFVVGYVIVMILGVSIGYHRYLSHGSFKTSNFWKTILLYCGVLSCQGSPLYWANLHRGYHHKHADTDKDPHTPKHGFFHSYIGWLWKIDKCYVSFRKAPELLKDKIVVFFHRKYTHIILGTYLIVGLININWLLYGLILPALITFHVWCMITSVSHCSKFSYRNFDTQDNSLNIVWLWPLAFGEAWHNNHHHKQRSSSTQHKRFEIDPAATIINLIKVK